MGRLFDAVLQRVSALGPVAVAVAEGHDPAALEAIAQASCHGFARAELVGSRAKIEEALSSVSIPAEAVNIVESKSPEESAAKAVELVRTGKASILMKGKMHTSVLLRAVLDKEKGLRTGKVLSHTAALEVPGFDRFIFVADGGVNIAPDLERKIGIVENAIEVAQALGVSEPRVALLCAVEVPTADYPATLDAAIIAKMAERGVFQGAIVDGPLALDVAVSPESAAIKKVGGPVAGKADILIAPDITTGNSVAKSMQYFAGALMGGVITGATHPVVVISRADTARVKLCSLAVARCLVGPNSGL